METQRHMVAQSLLIPNHGVYPVRDSKEEPKAKPKAGEERIPKEEHPPFKVRDVDHGEW